MTRMDHRISLLTLGARDVDALAAFYDGLGWARVDSPDGVVAYDLIGQTLGLYPLEKLAEDIGVSPLDLGRGAMTFGYNVREKSEVAEIVNKAVAIGASLLKPPQDVFWGGHHAYFADPEGHIWEIAWNPFSPLSEKGEFRWLGYSEGP